MLITDCPYCNEPQVFNWEAEDQGGWFPSKCYKCKNVMWVEATVSGGETLSHEEFRQEIMQPEHEKHIEYAKHTAENQSAIVYDDIKTQGSRLL